MRGRRTTSILAVLGFAGLTAGALGGAPATARTPISPVELGGVNVISGDHITGVNVRIPRATTIEGDPFTNENVSYDGTGRILGVVLVEQGQPAHKPFQLISVQWTFCGEPGCKGRRFDRTEITTTSDWRGKRWRIPAGDYHLYLVADGAPVDVTLRLDGLDGRTELHPSGDVTGRIAAPQPTIAEFPTDHLYFGRAKTMVMPTAGLLIDGDSVDFGLGPSHGTRGSCFWRARGEEDLEHSTPGPHCLRFAERGGWATGTSTLGGGNAGWGIGTVPAGKWRSSYWAATVAALPESDFLTLWLAYEDPAQ